jgi:hypothetical protein
VGRHFPAGGLGRSAVGGPGDGGICWRLGPWPRQGQLASPRAEETSSDEKGLSGYGTNGHAYDRGLGRLDSLACAVGNRKATVNYTVELQCRAIGPVRREKVEPR